MPWETTEHRIRSGHEALNMYGFDDRRDLTAVLLVCTLHFPMFFSTRKPVEVVCA